MPKTRPPYLHRVKTRHGSFVWYFQRKGEKRIRIRGVHGTPEFKAAYEAALSGSAVTTISPNARMSMQWCIEQFMASSKWARLAGESRKQLSYQYLRIIENAGNKLLPAITRKHILDGQDRRRQVPSDAN